MSFLATNLGCSLALCTFPPQPSGPLCKMGPVAPTWEGRKTSWCKWPAQKKGLTLDRCSDGTCIGYSHISNKETETQRGHDLTQATWWLAAPPGYQAPRWLLVLALSLHPSTSAA